MPTIKGISKAVKNIAKAIAAPAHKLAKQISRWQTPDLHVVSQVPALADVGHVRNNPLYEAAGNSRQNPLYQPPVA